MEMSSGGEELDRYADSVGLVFDTDPSMMEPYQRCRSNTWHGRARVVNDDKRSMLSNRVDSPAESCDSSFGALNSDSPGGLGPTRTASRKPASRRNAWGNLSYADLITKAIESSPEKRLTLAQIYDWMVTNVPFFKDKGDSNSSAGWKVRKLISLSCFIRCAPVTDSGPLSQKSAGHMQNRKTKTNTNPSPDPNRYRRRCPDPNARIQKFIHYMAIATFAIADCHPVTS